jgi:hypothetical protein
MPRRLRRHLRLLHAYVVLTSVALVVVAASAFTQGPAPNTFEEITVQRINVVDANGTLRLVIANKDRMHPGVIDGKTINRPRPVAGMIFFNDEGDEVGGLVVAGHERDGQRRATGMLAFDQLKQDQTVAISYSEGDGQRTAGLQVWDRPDSRLGDLIDQLNAANAIADASAREKAIQQVRANAPPAPRRVFVGKSADRSATVSLADGRGQPRLTLKVGEDGTASLEFLDAEGKVVERLPSRGASGR